MASVASSATSVLIAHVAAQTTSIRLGSGGVMLPNHSPLTIAEQFGTLATLHPDRIDLGLGRAPGGDHLKVPPQIAAHVEPMLAGSAVGTPDQITTRLSSFYDQLQPDEFILSMPFYEQAARLKSMELAMSIQDHIGPTKRAA